MALKWHKNLNFFVVNRIRPNFGGLLLLVVVINRPSFNQIYWIQRKKKIEKILCVWIWDESKGGHGKADNMQKPNLKLVRGNLLYLGNILAYFFFRKKITCTRENLGENGFFTTFLKKSDIYGVHTGPRDFFAKKKICQNVLIYV